MAELRKRDLLKNGFEVYIDGGVRRAGDVIKAVALGAKAVGLGRPLLCMSSEIFKMISHDGKLTGFFWTDAYCAYGKEGVVRAIQLLKDEMEMK